MRLGLDVAEVKMWLTYVGDAADTWSRCGWNVADICINALRVISYLKCCVKLNCLTLLYPNLPRFTLIYPDICGLPWVTLIYPDVPCFALIYPDKPWLILIPPWLTWLNCKEFAKLWLSDWKMATREASKNQPKISLDWLWYNSKLT